MKKKRKMVKLNTNKNIIVNAAGHTFLVGQDAVIRKVWSR